MRKISSLILFLFSLILFFLLIFPKIQNLIYLKKEISLKERELKFQNEYFSQLGEISNQLKEYQESLDKIDFALPKDPGFPEILNFLQNISSQIGLSLKEIKLVSSPQTQEKLKENKINLSFNGNYPSFLNFLSLLEKSARLIEVEQTSISVPEKEGQIEFNLLIKFYNYKE